MRSWGISQLPSRRGSRVVQGCGSFPSARAVPGFLASGDGPARAGAHRLCFVGSIAAWGPLAGSGAGTAPGVAFGLTMCSSRQPGTWWGRTDRPRPAAA
jgi:hypothetical protein